MYDIIFSDYDFTLYGKSGKVSQKTKDAIQRYISSGGKFVISTGRIYQSVKPVAKDLGLTGDIITSQGSQIYNIDTDLPVLTTYPNPELVVEILEYAKKKKMLAQCYADNKVYADFHLVFNGFCKRFFGMTINKTFRLPKLVRYGKIKPNKFELIIKEDAIDKELEYLSEKYPLLLFSKSATFMLEIVSKEATKGEATKYLLNRYGVPKERAVAIGDGNNDLDMMDAVGLKVAVSNGESKLKEKADYITKNIEGDGVAELIDLILEGKL